MCLMASDADHKNIPLMSNFQSTKLLKDLNTTHLSQFKIILYYGEYTYITQLFCCYIFCQQRQKLFTSPFKYAILEVK